MRRRGLAYAAVVLLAAVGTWVWFTLAEEVAQDASEPAAYGFFLTLTVLGAVLVAFLGCGLVEVGVRIRARLAQSSRT